jgi:hypothetical protein
VWSRILDGAWLKQTYDQPRQERAERFKAEYFVGYDPNRKAWVRFGVMTTGQYFAIRMTDTEGGGWAWKYVSFFPRITPETATPDTVLTRVSDTRYTVTGPTYPNSDGSIVTEHHVCNKAFN